MLLAAIPSRECEVESVTGSFLEGSHDVPAPNVLDVGVRVQGIRECDDDPKIIYNRLPVFQTMDRVENESTTGPASDSAWNRRALESLRMYRELSAAHIPAEFVSVRLRLEREWTFNGGFVSQFTIMFCF